MKQHIMNNIRERLKEDFKLEIDEIIIEMIILLYKKIKEESDIF